MVDGDTKPAKMRPLDSSLLGSFPAPPTHIPRTPTSPNPPPSRPPSSPLPPIPAQRRPFDSISSIDVRDILDAISSDEEALAGLPPFVAPRSSSPDILTIISTTPRPRAKSLNHKSAVKRRASESYAIYAPPSDDDDTRSWIDHDDFGRPVPPTWSPELYDSDASDDSSLDLHTPLPHLMMRHGLLSPNSRLIAQPSARDSVVSIASTTTSKSTRPVKDARDTAQRRVRHRDGRLLRGGIGLTTGLGWSDSEDEGAPSPLTRRISSLNLSMASRSSLALSRSTTSLSSDPSRSSGSDHRASLPERKYTTRPVARSFSSTTSFRSSEYSFVGDVDEFGKIPGAGVGAGARCPSAFKSSTTSGAGATLKREKSLPPIPRGSVLERRSAGASTGAMEWERERERERERSVSGGSDASTGSLRGTATAMKTPRPLRLVTPTHAPAPLLLAQRQRPVPVSVDTNVRSPSTPSPVTPARPTPTLRPRVGTGMTYRSSGSAGRLSKMQMQVQKPIPL